MFLFYVQNFFKKGDTIEGGTLFKGGHYLRKYCTFLIYICTVTIGSVDIMAQQFKFIACLKIMMEELSTLATGFEVDGGLLR